MDVKKSVTKITAYVCILGVVLISNAPVVSAYEAHVMGVTATIIDNDVNISPDGGSFCNDGKLKIEIESDMEDTEIFYTTDGSEPKCGSGQEYSKPFTLLRSATVKAVACYGNKRGPVKTEVFDVSSDYCQKSLKINKVYYYADASHGDGTNDADNEWVEIYNPAKEDANIKGWSICNSESCDKLADRDLVIPAKGYAVVAYKRNTWGYWNIPGDVVKINLSSLIGSGLGNTADMLLIKDAKGNVIDQMNWGKANTMWNNYNDGVWAKGVLIASPGTIIGRITNGYDTDSASDWKIFKAPEVTVNYPNGGETWIIGKYYTIEWTADNPNGDDDDLSVDIYYSADSGKTWATVVKNTENDGEYKWRLPLAVKENGSNYFTVSNTARIKVVATDYGRNFMLTGKDVSDGDFCPPIDKSLLTDEELRLLEETDTTGMLIVDSKTAAEMEKNSTTKPVTGDDKEGAQIEKSDMLNREEDEFAINGEMSSDGDEKNGNKRKDGIKSVTDDVPLGKDLAKVSNGITDDSKYSAGQVSGATADDMPIAPDGDIIIEFNLHS
jgi:hypothetical protein